MKEFFTVCTCIGLILFSISSAQAEPQTYTKDITYQACELDNAFSSRVIAKEKVKQRIFDELADTAEDWSKEYKFEFSRESGIPMFSCLIKIETVKEEWNDPALHYEAETKSDLGAVLQSIGTIRDEKFPTTDIAANRTAANHALKEIEQIKAEVASSGNKDGKQAAYDKAVSRLHAADWYEKASFSLFGKEFDQAIEGYTKAIEYDPLLVTAYQKRASLYHTHLKDTEKVILDAMRISRIYFNRGIDDYQSKKFRECISNLDNSIKWNIRDAEAYYQRAACKIGSGDQGGVQEDFVEAAKLGHEQSKKLLTARGIEF